MTALVRTLFLRPTHMDVMFAPLERLLPHFFELFFPRVRTPCGHGAQVIVEGRESQSDGGENNKDNKQKANRTPKRPTGRVSTIM